MFKGLFTNLWITDYFCFSTLSVFISDTALFFNSSTCRRLDQRREDKMGQGIIVFQTKIRTTGPHSERNRLVWSLSQLPQTQSHGWQNMTKQFC